MRPKPASFHQQLAMAKKPSEVGRSLLWLRYGKWYPPEMKDETKNFGYEAWPKSLGGFLEAVLPAKADLDLGVGQNYTRNWSSLVPFTHVGGLPYF